MITFFPGILSPWPGPVRLLGRQQRLPGIICLQEIVKTGYWDVEARFPPFWGSDLEVQDGCAHQQGRGWGGGWVLRNILVAAFAFGPFILEAHAHTVAPHKQEHLIDESLVGILREVLRLYPVEV